MVTPLRSISTRTLSHEAYHYQIWGIQLDNDNITLVPTTKFVHRHISVSISISPLTFNTVPSIRKITPNPSQTSAPTPKKQRQGKKKTKDQPAKHPPQKTNQAKEGGRRRRKGTEKIKRKQKTCPQNPNPKRTSLPPNHSNNTKPPNQTGLLSAPSSPHPTSASTPSSPTKSTSSQTSSPQTSVKITSHSSPPCP